jgi:hypothetical protein
LSEPEANPGQCAWARTTTWRQGSVLPLDASRATGLLENYGTGALQVVISHDCDCVQDEDRDPLLEVISGRFVETADPNFTHNKNPRILDITVTKSGVQRVIRFEIDSRLFVKKIDLLPFVPDPEILFSETEKLILIRWIASRYNRASLPDALVERLRLAMDTLKNIAMRNPFAILGIYLDYDPRGEILSDDEPYELRIAIVYDSNEDGAAQAASEAAKTLWTRFERKYKIVETPNAGLQWKLIELTQCEAISDISFSLRDALDYKFYHFEHISLRQTPVAEIPTILS